MSLNSVNYNIKFDTANFHVEVSSENEHGWFEHLEHGDECGGSLTFEGNNLVDYDGTFSLPQEVARGLAEHKLTVDAEFFD